MASANNTSGWRKATTIQICLQALSPVVVQWLPNQPMVWPIPSVYCGKQGKPVFQGLCPVGTRPCFLFLADLAVIFLNGTGPRRISAVDWRYPVILSLLSRHDSITTAYSPLHFSSRLSNPVPPVSAYSPINMLQFPHELFGAPVTGMSDQVSCLTGNTEPDE